MYFFMRKHEKNRLTLNRGGTKSVAQLGSEVPLMESDVAVQVQKSQLKQPSLYRVWLLNDDYTPMDFVVEVLQHVFHMEIEQATQVMLTVHTQGRAVCGIYPRDIAETKMLQVNEFSEQNQHPLLCQIESVD